MTKKVFLNIFLIYNIIFSNISFAETFNAGVGFGKPSEFVFQNYKNQELISLRLLGAVRKEGVYHVPKNINLPTLLSLAGGFAKDAKIDDIQIGGPIRKKTISLDLNESISKNTRNQFYFKTNDTVFVKRDEPFISDKSFRVISVISVFLTAALTAVIINEKVSTK